MRDTRTISHDDLRGRTKQPWRELVAPYAKPDTRRALIQLLNTAVPFLAIMAALLYGLHHEIWAILALVLPAAGLLVRLFTIQHDCGHGSFFKSRRANDLIGRLIGVATLTPYGFWRKSHAMHHASSGNLDRRGVGDVTTLTIGEYLSRPAWRRAVYRLYRHPIVLFGFGPAYQFFIHHRIPTGRSFRDRQAWLSIFGTNIAIATLVAAMGLTVGLQVFLLSYVPTMMLAGAIGVWFFYIQHQFEDAYWERAADWKFDEAALQGSSFYDLPAALHWMTGHIGFHHLHHLCSRIPNYRLRACFDANPEFQTPKRLTLAASLRCATLALWDGEHRKLVPFRHARRLAQAAVLAERCATSV